LRREKIDGRRADGGRKAKRDARHDRYDTRERQDAQINRDEIDASVDLFHALHGVMRERFGRRG